MNITPCTLISIENLLFGSDNLTDENNLIVFRNVQKYIHHTNRFEWYEIILCTQDAIIYLRTIPSPSPFFPLLLFIKYIDVYIYYICHLLSFYIMCITLLYGEDVLS
jgi:hypothetical protein